MEPGSRRMTFLEMHRLETCELVAWEDLFRAAPPTLSDEAGILLEDSELGLVGCVATADVLALNRVVGLGLRRDATPDAALSLIQLYDRNAVSRFFVPVSPVAAPDSIASDLERYGLRHYNNWIRLFRSTSPVPSGLTDLEIRIVDPNQAVEFGAIVCRNFGWPEQLAPWIAATVGRPNWVHWMAFDGEKPVATAALYKRGHCAWLDLATTDAAARGRGAQSALLAARVRKAGALGCDLVTLETAEPKQGVSAPSYRNAIRLGFEVAYARPNYIWERTPSAS